MIRAVIFDLDGTLVDTEQLKAASYAQAAVSLCPRTLDETSVIEVYKEVVGRSRREVAQTLVYRFDLAPKAEERMAAFGADRPWQAFVKVRLKIYQEMLADPQILRNNQWPLTMNLLENAHAQGCTTALATMSHGERASYILSVLELSDAFEFIATCDDVTHGKPDPEIYRLVAEELSVSPEESLVIEDSPAGVAAAVSAGMRCVAVATPFTKDPLHKSRLLENRWIVDDSAKLLEVVAEAMVGG